MAQQHSLVHSDIEHRNARAGDEEAIGTLLSHYAALGDLLPRPKAEIVANLANFRVILVAGKIVACGSLEHFTDELAEVRSLMVAPGLKASGYGGVILTALISNAQERGVKRLMALTYVPEFFHKFGFSTVNKAIFPEKIWGICVNCYKFHNCDEIAVLLEL